MSSSDPWLFWLVRLRGAAQPFVQAENRSAVGLIPTSRVTSGGMEMTLVRVESFTISLDGYGAGPDQGVENPLGVGGEALHDWVVATRSWRQMHG